MPDATLTTEGSRPVVTLERQLHRSPAAVWRALTEPEEVRAWFPGSIEADPGWAVGAALRFVDQGMPEPATGVVLELEEPRRLSYTWWDDILRFELSGLPDGGTLLALSDELPAARNAAGWEVCLARLFREGGPDLEWTPLFDHYVSEFEPVLGHQDGPPAEYRPPTEGSS